MPLVNPKVSKQVFWNLCAFRYLFKQCQKAINERNLSSSLLIWRKEGICRNLIIRSFPFFKRPFTVVESLQCRRIEFSFRSNTSAAVILSFQGFIALCNDQILRSLELKKIDLITSSSPRYLSSLCVVLGWSISNNECAYHLRWGDCGFTIAWQHMFEFVGYTLFHGCFQSLWCQQKPRYFFYWHINF